LRFDYYGVVFSVRLKYCWDLFSWLVSHVYCFKKKDGEE
jgi:hypothetical protein